MSQEVGDIIDFDVCSAEVQRSHRGRIERIPVHELPWPACETDDGLVVGSHRLWVDDCHIPEYSTWSSSDYASQGYHEVYRTRLEMGKA